MINKYTNVEQISGVSLTIAVFVFLTGCITAAQASDNNPWLGSAVGHDEGKNSVTIRSHWRQDKKPAAENAFDESKYPPLDENEALGLESIDPNANDDVKTDAGKNEPGVLFMYPQTQDFDSIPVYSGLNQNSAGSAYSRQDRAYGSRPYPQGMYRQPYKSSYGANRGFPGGFPFGGNNSSSMPFGMSNDWMPFSNTGFW